MNVGAALCGLVALVVLVAACCAPLALWCLLSAANRGTTRLAREQAAARAAAIRTADALERLSPRP